jgi:dTMP kinase
MTFITFEGGEGSGKSTQVKLLEKRLQTLGYDVVVTREPGGTPQGEALRPLLVSGESNRWSPEAEALLMYAARAENVARNVRPALAAGKIILCDRFFDSTDVYQGYAGGVSQKLLSSLKEVIVGTVVPNLTLVFDIDPEQGLKRAAARRGVSEDQFEKRGLAFHQKLRNGFLQLCMAEPVRCKRIDAARSIEAIEAEIWFHVGPMITHGR